MMESALRGVYWEGEQTRENPGLGKYGEDKGAEVRGEGRR